PGETPEAALVRELGEELGLERFEIGPLLLRRRHTFDWLGRRIRQSEQLFAVRTERFEPRFSDNVEALVFRSFRWWTLDELRNTSESVTPTTLATLVSDFLEHGAPKEVPLEVRE
ncbi:MAG TPA: NUDIX domain-containing protein, partial [Gemmatimonadales bacterium]|nr:NUDIX domain-containing protein [Gemmatimonadales bacterium]